MDSLERGETTAALIGLQAEVKFGLRELRDMQTATLAEVKRINGSVAELGRWRIQHESELNANGGIWPWRSTIDSRLSILEDHHRDGKIAQAAKESVWKSQLALLTAGGIAGGALVQVLRVMGII